MYIKVYLILAHTKPQQVENLIQLLQDDTSLFFIHLDKKINATFFENCSGLKATHFIKNNVKCSWGKFSLVQATLNSFVEINSFMSQNYNNSDYHCILLSGEDMPLQSNQKIHQFLEHQFQNSFLHHWKLPSNKWWNGGMFRFESLYVFEYNTHKKRNYWINRFLRKANLQFVFPINRFKKKYPGITFFGGSQWMILSKKMMLDVVNVSLQNKKFASLFRYVLAPDELYFPMLINHFIKEETTSIKNSPTHLVLFEGAKSNPKYLTRSDIQNAYSETLLFARKFDTDKNNDAIELLMQLRSK